MITTLIILIGILVFLIFQDRHTSLLNKKLAVEIAEIKERNKKLQEKIEKLLLYIPLPLMITDKKGTIKFANTELENITGIKPAGHNYIEFFNQSEFIEAVHNILEKGIPSVKEISYKERSYTFSFTLLEDEEIFIALKDITDTREIARIKKELISNISHELKTPLTVIKGYLETIYEEAPSVLKNQIEIIKNHTERLTGIVNDLLKLSELEEVKIEFQDINIKEIIEKVIMMFKKQIDQKNLSLKVDIDSSITHLKGDPYKMEDLLINLIDNAIRYTDRGGIKVKTEKKDTEIVIRIKDTGIGIPEKSIPRIFERFYVVDKSRSRQTGGTGLGLAIVKHIVMLHKGTIDIKSSLGEGTEVIVTLPIN